MSQPNAGGKKGEKLDRFECMLGIRARDPPPTGNDKISSASMIIPALEAARSLSPSGENSARQSPRQIPGISTPEPLGDPRVGFVAPALHPVVRNTALALSSSGQDTAPAPQAEIASEKNLPAQALGILSEKDKSALEANETRSKLDIEAFRAGVRGKRETCLKNQWEFEFRGRAINLRYQADKIISWLAKCKEVGNTVIQYDPSHAAPPWTGIRFLLQVSPTTLFNILC